MVDGKSIYLGSFSTAIEAHAVYMRAAKEYFGEFARGGGIFLDLDRAVRTPNRRILSREFPLAEN
jgi:hypothetical protein